MRCVSHLPRFTTPPVQIGQLPASASLLAYLSQARGQAVSGP